VPINPASSPTSLDSHLQALDGYRGLLALWVYFGHLAYAVGYHNYLLGLHALAVDLFMVLSGFLMFRSWSRGLSSERTFFERAVQFYKARFFRIAPLYYLLLLVCFIFLPSLTAMYDFIQKTMPPPWAEGLSDYNPSAGWNFDSIRWLYLHATFTYGLVPGMEASTPLPDWSLSLEMQFYFVFPFLFWLMLRSPLLLLSTLVAGAAIAAPLLFGNYLTPGSVAHFGQPSLLPYRLNAFVAGMLIAYYLSLRLAGKLTQRTSILLFLASAVCIAPLTKPVILAYVLFALLTTQRLPFLTAALSLPPLRILGNISYSIYLVHLLVVIPCVYWLLTSSFFLQLSANIRFVVALCLSAPIVCGLSYALYRYVELPSMRIGKGSVLISTFKSST
jgi:peptidoglycan/LPS O-acetylase OafA/YrhL